MRKTSPHPHTNVVPKKNVPESIGRSVGWLVTGLKTVILQEVDSTSSFPLASSHVEAPVEWSLSSSYVAIGLAQKSHVDQPLKGERKIKIRYASPDRWSTRIILETQITHLPNR